MPVLAACGVKDEPTPTVESDAAFGAAYSHVPDNVPLRRQLWAWAAAIRRVEPPPDMPDNAVRGIGVAERVYRDAAHGKATSAYDLPAMRAFRAFGDERCGEPSGPYFVRE